MGGLAESDLGDLGTHGQEQTGTSFGTELTARILATLFAAGSTLALLTVALPHSARTSTLAVLAIVAVAYAVSGALYWNAPRLQASLLPWALAAGSTLIALVCHFSAPSPSPLLFLYLWIFLYSAYFFTTTEMVVQIAYAVAGYAAVLLEHSSVDRSAGWWLVGLGTMGVAAMVIRIMRARVEALIAQLFDAARTDPVTRLANRRGFRELLDLELARARRREGKLTLLVGDLDHFREVNDRSGRQVGDAALRRVARVLDDGKREVDAVARVGGEQFGLVLPDADEHAAFVVAERLRSLVMEEFAQDAVPLTISFGVASYPRSGETAAALVRSTDEAQRAAKRHGRNRTVLHNPAIRAAAAEEDATRDVVSERFLAVMLDLAEAIDLRFSGSARHSETVGRYAEMMASELGLPKQRAARVRLAGLLHDIGKVGVPDAILHKPGKLTEEEFAVIKRHPELGAQMLDHPSLADVREWVGAHHEQPNGGGYPSGLSGERIPLEARIIAVADAYEAMTSDRSYRSSLDHLSAREELERCAGTQFDPRVVEALCALLERETDRAELALGRS
jgi:diguanylate cyclase (GGDEF)-like protein/putative nucleotidyltransferase with HDIG domain